MINRSMRWSAALLALTTSLGVLRAEQSEELLKHLTVAEGLTVSVWARAPMFFNPTGMDVDDRGRIWISEAVNYRGFNSRKKERHWHDDGDRIVILEDTDNDGRADASKVFVQDKDLVAPLGVTVVGDRVLVSCSPHLLIYTKNDKDEVVKKEVFLTGWGGLDHDHSLHKAEVGPDGRWYLNAGNAGPHVVKGSDGWTLRVGSVYRGGSPHNKTNTSGLVSDDGRAYTSGVLVSIRPDGTDMRVVGHNYRNPYGHGLDSFGNVWMNDNDDTQSCRTSWIMRFSNSGYSSLDGTRSWRADQRPGQSVRSAHWRQEDPGVIPSGHVYGNGAPTGLAYYENGALGEAYEGGLLLSCEAGQNVVWAYRRVVEGAGFKLEGFPFLASTGKQDPNYVWHKRETNRAMWFRPSDVIVGTDGAIYVCDWYDAVVGGHQMDDTTSNGTIYRITATGTTSGAPGHETPSDYLSSPAPSVRNTGYRKLAEQGDSAIPALKKMLARSDRFVRARAVWVLAALGEEGVSELESLLKDPDPEIRATAFRALEQSGQPILKHASALAREPSPIVRREIALSMRDMSFTDARDILFEIASTYDGEDRWYLEALGRGCEGKEQDIYAVLLGRLGSPTSSWSDPFADIVWRLHPNTSIPALNDRIQNSGLPTEQRQQAINTLAFTAHKAGVAAMQAAADKGPEDLRPLAVYWLRHRSRNTWSEFGIQVADQPKPEPRPAGKPTAKEQFRSKLLKKGFVDIDLDISGASTLQLIATDGGNGNSCDWIDWLNPVLIDKDGKAHDLTRMNWTGLENGWGSVHKGKSCQGTPFKVNGEGYAIGLGGHAPMRVDYMVPGQNFVRFRVRAAVDDGSPEKGGATYKDQMASVVFRIHHDGRKIDSKSPVEAALKLTGDPVAGAGLFSSMACVTCHTFNRQGRQFGPDLTSIRMKLALRPLMEAISEPDAGILVGYETTLIETNDRQSLYGFVISDGDIVVLKDPSGTEHALPRKKITRRETQTTSLMPRLQFQPQQLADLAAYLRTEGK